jgi:hypothetical protein
MGLGCELIELLAFETVKQDILGYLVKLPGADELGALAIFRHDQIL